MKKSIFVLLFAIASLGASAQINGIDNDNRFGTGQDSINCLEKITICDINVQNKDFATAYEAWKELFTKYPVARVSIYTNGEKILKGLISKETDDQQIKYIDKLQQITKSQLSAGKILGKKALDYMQFVPKASVDEA